MISITARQFHTYPRSPWWWTGYFLSLGVILVSIVLSYQTGSEGIQRSWLIGLNSFFVLALWGVYWYVVVHTNPSYTVTLDDEGNLYRGQKYWCDTKDYAAWASTSDYYGVGQCVEIVLLDEEGYILQSCIVNATDDLLEDFMDSLEKFLPKTSAVQYHRYEKLQRILKV